MVHLTKLTILSHCFKKILPSIENHSFRRIAQQNFSISASLNADRFFTKKHEWVEVSDDKTTGMVGISSYAQEALGDVVFVQLPEVDEKVTKGEECGALESVKAASELYSPVSGNVIHKNELVEKAPSLINSSPHDEGWLFKVSLSDAGELADLLDEKNYEAYLKMQEEDGH